MVEKRATRKQVKTTHLSALLLGYNELATRAKVLGEKIYFRLAVDDIAAKLRALGHEVCTDRGAEILTLRERPPHILLYEKDIEAMRACVAEWDTKKGGEHG